MQRRALMTIAASTTATLAGCPGSSASGSGSSNGDPTETGTPAPANITASLSAPETVTVGATATLTVEVQNSGGKPGSFEGALSATGDSLDFSETVTVAEVPPGGTVTEEFEVSLQYAGSSSFELTGESLDGPAEATIEATARKVAIGERFGLSDDLNATVSDVELTTMVRTVRRRDSHYGPLSTPRDVVAVLPAPTGSTLALVEVGLENTGTTSSTFDAKQVGLADGEFYPGGIVGELAGDKLSFAGGSTLEPSQTETGYLVAKAPTETLQNEGLTLEVQGDAAETPPETQLTYQPETVPRPKFEVVDMQAPDEMPTGQQYDVSITVRNAGETSGKLNGVFQWKYLEADSFDNPRWMDDRLANPKTPTVTIPAGETRDITLTTSSEGEGKFAYRLAPLNGTTVTTTFTD